MCSSIRFGRTARRPRTIINGKATALRAQSDKNSSTNRRGLALVSLDAGGVDHSGVALQITNRRQDLIFGVTREDGASGLVLPGSDLDH